MIPQQCGSICFLLKKQQCLKSSFMIVACNAILTCVIIMMFFQNVNISDLKHYETITINFTKEDVFETPEIIDFEGFDNNVGASQYIIPNYVHLVYLNYTRITFQQMISIFSIYLNQKPDRLYIHCDNCSFIGKYWDAIKNNTNLWNIIRIKKVPKKETIYNVKIGWIHHRLVGGLNDLIYLAFNQTIF